jgi:AcrR family transcriptional regulator
MDALVLDAVNLARSPGQDKEHAMTATVPRLDTRDELIRSAERLFSSHGIDGVSLRAINQAAGQRNSSALQYHFTDRNGLVRAVLAKHRAVTDPRRHALLDQYEVDGNQDLRPLAAALVLPLATKLHDPDGGRAFLQINAEVYTRAGSVLELVPRPDRADSVRRWHRIADSLLPVTERKVLHTRFAANRFAFVELGRRAAAPPRRDDRLFTSHLIDLVTALLTAVPSVRTRELLDERSSKRNTRSATSSSR